MNDFDIDAYLSGRRRIDSKLESLREASEQKRLGLQRYSEQANAVEQAPDNSWSGKLGLEPTSFLSNRVNDVASLVSGTTRLAGQIASLPDNITSAGELSWADQRDIDAWNRKKAGNALPEDQAILERRPISPFTPTIAERLQLAESRGQRGRDIARFFDTSSIVNQSNRNNLAQDLGEGFADSWGQVTGAVDKAKEGNLLGAAGSAASGLAGLLANAGSAVLTNPSAVREYIIENAPQLLVGAYGRAGQAALTASNIGYAADYFQQGLENHAKANNGQLPSEDQIRRIAALSASLALAEQGSDMLMLGAGKLAGRSAVAATDAAGTAARTGAFKNILKATGAGVASEAPTEGYQTWAEGEITGKPASAQDIYTGAVIGGAAGGGLTGGMRAVAELTGATPEKAKEREVKAAQQTVRDIALATGNVDALLDTASPSYSPTDAIVTLQTLATREGVDEETRTKNREQAGKIVSDLIEQRDELQANYDRLTPDGLKREIQNLKGDLAQTDPANTEAVENQTARLSILEKQLGQFDNPDFAAAFKQQAVGIKVKLNAINDNLTSAQKAFNVFDRETAVRDTTGTVVDVDATVAGIATAATAGQLEKAQAGARKLINLSMASPGSIDLKLARALANDAANGLTDQQRDYFRKFSDARQAENARQTVDTVSADITLGVNGNESLSGYRSKINALLTSGNKAGAERLLAQLGRFNEDHQGKAAAIVEAYKRFRVDKQDRSIASDGNRGWVVRDTPFATSKARKQNGGLNIAANSVKLVRQIPAASKVINATLAELQAAYDLKFNPSTPTAPSPNVTQTPEAQQGQAQGQEVPAATGTDGAPAAATDAGVTVPSGNGAAAPATGTVETAGVAVTEGTNENSVTSDEGASGSSVDTGMDPFAEANSAASEAAAESTEETEVETEGLNQSTEETITAQPAAVSETGTATPFDDGGQEQTQADQATEQGLSVFENSDQTLPKDKPWGMLYQTMNRLVAFMKQTKRQIEDDADIPKDRPLVSIRNFLSRWIKGDISAEEFFPKDPKDLERSPLTEDELGSLETFKSFAQQWLPIVRQLLKQGGAENIRGNTLNPKFAYRDPTWDFYNKDGSIDENVATAVVYAAYNWFIDASNGSPRKMNEDVLKMFGLSEDDAYVDNSAESTKDVRTVSGFKDTLVSSMGRYAYDALGLKPEDNAPVTYPQRVQTALGLLAFTLLSSPKVGLIELVTIKGDELNKSVVGLESKQSEKEVTIDGEVFLEPQFDKDGNPIFPLFEFIRIKRVENDGKLELEGESLRIRDSAQNARGVLQRLISTEASTAHAGFAPRRFTQERAKKTEQGVPERLRQIIDQAQQVPHRVIEDMWSAMGVLGDAVVLQAAGLRDPDVERIHVDNLDAVQAKNDSLTEQLRSAKSLIEGAIKDGDDGIKTALYVSYEVWKNYRVGVATRDLNMQGSKIHRAIFTRPDWEATFRIDDTTKVNHFKIAVAQAFGLKIDAKPNSETLPVFDAYVADEKTGVNRLALKLAQSIVTPSVTTLTASEKADIGKFAADNEGMQSLQALVMWGKFLLAQQNGQEEVSVQLLVGVDGKTNGPMFTHLALGAADTLEQMNALLNRGGFFEEGSEHKNFNFWKNAKDRFGNDHADLYEALAAAIVANLPDSDNLNAIYTFTKELYSNNKVTSSGRKLAKTPLTSFVFGSSVAKSKSNMESWFVETILERIEDVANGKKTGVTIKQIVRSLNQLANLGISENATIEDLLTRGFTEKEKNRLKEAFGETFGKAVDTAMESEFGAYMKRRDAVNNQLQASFGIYNAMFSELYDDEMQRLMDLGGVPFRTTKEGVRIPLESMTIAQQQSFRTRLAALLPLVHTLYSQEEGKIENGLLMAKTRKSAGRETMHEVQVWLGRLIDSAANSKNWRTNQTTGRAVMTLESSPGVAGLPYMIHSADSYTMHDSIGQGQALNVHDEKANGLDHITKDAQDINGSAFKMLLNYSPALQAYNLLMRMVVNADVFSTNGGLSYETLKGIENTLREVEKRQLKQQNPGKRVRSTTAIKDLVEQMVRGAYSDYRAADMMRLQTLAQIAYVDQYTWEGGEYTVTPELRDEAKKMLAELTAKLQPEAEVIEAAKRLGEMLASNKAPAQPKTAPKPKLPKVKLEDDSAVRISAAFGPLGKPNVAPERDLVAYFSKNPNPKASDVIAYLQKEGKLNGVNAKILGLVARSLQSSDADIRFRFVTRKPDFDKILSLPQGPSKGWYVATEEGKTEIYVLHPDYVNSGLTTELLLHEMTHAALARLIANPSPDAQPLVDELEQLRQAALDLAVSKGLVQQDAEGNIVGPYPYAEGLRDLQELVAYGMTNRDFQTKILVPVTMQSKTLGNRLVSAMQAFIANLQQLLFKKPNEQLQSGLNILITNVSGLLAEAGMQEQGKQTTLNQSMAAAQAVESYTTMQVFEAMGTGSVSPAFRTQLEGLLTGIVETLYGPFGSMANAMRKTEAGNAMAVWLKAVETGQTPFIASRVHANLLGSPHEDFVSQQVGAVVRASLDRNEVTATPVYRALDKLYKEAFAKLSPADFSSQEEYDAFFSLGSGRGDRSDHLARFAALGLGNERINALLQFETQMDRSPWLEGNTITAKLTHLFEKILSLFNDRMARVYGGQQADEKLQSLVSKLVDIEARKRHALDQEVTQSKYRINIDKTVQTLAEAAKEKVVGLTESRLVQGSKSQAVKAMGNIVRVVAQDRVDDVIGALRKLRDQQFNERDGLGASLLNEFKGHNQMFQALLRATKHLEGVRKDTIIQHAKLALKSFIGGEEFNKDQKEGITSVFLRTGMHNLLKDFSVEEMQTLLSDQTALDKTISDWEAKLPASMRDAYIEQVNGLGYFKATGRNRTPTLMLNAHLISRMAGTPFESRISTSMAEQAQPTLTVLATLYSMKYLNDLQYPRSQVLLAAAIDVMRAENGRTDGGNGVEFMLRLHKELEKDSLERLFNGNPALMMHGYTPEIYNPHTAIQVANEEDGARLVEQGYVRDAEVTQDMVDPDQDLMHIYVLKDGGLAPYLSGVLSWTGMKVRGDTKHNGFMNPTYADGLLNASMQADISYDKLNQRIAMRNPKRDLRMDSTQNLAPVFNDAGKIVNWRYLMQESTKDRVLERDSRFDRVIGTLAGSIFDKVESREQNKTAVKALLEQYRLDYKNNPKAYVEVGLRAEDPAMRELWNMLPDKTQQDVISLWGGPSMMVRKDTVDILFGYRKYSLAEMFKKDPETRKWIEKTVVHVVEHMLYTVARTKLKMSENDAQRYKNRAAVFVTRGERMWQELVQETKDIIVVRSGIVLVGNILSNMSLLWVQGVPIKDMVRNHQVAIRAATAYQIDTARLAELEILVTTGNTDQAIQREIVLLKDAVARNPVKALIDEGLMPSIVDDVAAEEDIYSFKSEFARRTEGLADKLNPAVRKAGKNIFMTRDTWMYQVLFRTTQLSDFVARYTLYQHLTTRKDNPLSRKDAVQEASDAFVNYDIPMHKGLQYTDDMGITMFTKYFLRIQKVLLKSMKEHPARMLSLLALGDYLNLGSTVTSSSFVNKFGNNPLNLGALQFLWTWDDVVPVATAMKIVK